MKNDSERGKLLEQKLKEAVAEKDTLERQIAFRKEWISKVEFRLEKAKQGDSDDYVWRSTFGKDRDALFLKLSSELNLEYQALTSLQKEYSDLENRVRFLEEKLKKEQSSKFDFGWRKKDIHKGRGQSRELGESELKALQIIAQSDNSKGSIVARISRSLVVSYDYARLLWTSLGKADYIDITAEGKTKLTAKGEKALEEKGLGLWL